MLGAPCSGALGRMAQLSFSGLPPAPALSLLRMGLLHFAELHWRKSPSFEPKQPQLRCFGKAGALQGPSLAAARMDLGSGCCALGVLLALLTCQPLCTAHFHLLHSSYTPGYPGNIFCCHTASSAPCFGSFEAHESRVPWRKGCSETWNEKIRRICGFIQGEVHLCFAIKQKLP